MIFLILLNFKNLQKKKNTKTYCVLLSTELAIYKKTQTILILK